MVMTGDEKWNLVKVKRIICRQSANNNEKPQEVSLVKSGSNNILSSVVLLKTILLPVKTVKGVVNVRGLLDDGSQRSYISTQLAKRIDGTMLGKYFERNILFGGVITGIEERSIYEVQLYGINGSMYKLELANKDKITGSVEKLPPGPWMDELKSMGIRISDSESSIEDIDILLGADLLPKVMTDRSMLLECGLRVVETIFGWTIMGPIPKEVQLNTSMQMAVSLVNESDITQLWEMETIGIRDPVETKSKEERNRQVKEDFEKNISYTTDGKYEVSLPWVNGVQEIPDNFKVAEKRLINATKRLKEKGMYHTYDDLFKQWEVEGFIEEVKDANDAQCHYIPHHPVYKPESKTTPVRPVFDASCKVGRHPSLNECLEKGPNLIELIPDVMLQFRDGLIGVISDIRKAFQMICVQDEDQTFLLFLWWEDESCTKLKVFKHKRVVFGLTCSPFILGAVIEHHLNKVWPRDKEIAEKLKKSLYVDNSVTSVHSMEEYEHFKRNSIEILAKANMELRQWEHTEPGSTEEETENQDHFSAVLGMRWNKKKDTLSCASVPEIPEKLSKRSLLATINKVFDPMGILAPAMIYPKLMIQTTWKKKIGWDDEIPYEMREDFQKWANDLTYLQKIEIPRNMRGNFYLNEGSTEQLHVFCDGSQVAYAAVTFLRVESGNNVSVQLIQAKARVAPLQKMTSTRIELMACTIGTRLGTSVQRIFERNIPCVYWTDSTTALAWIGRNDEWGTFVGNRVREIVKSGTVNEWRHVPGKVNPADFPSRGGSPKQLLQSIWWEGPEWLKRPQIEWPNEQFQVDEKEVAAERKKSVVTSENLKVLAVVESPWYSKSSSYLLNLRSIAFLKRFAYNCMAKKQNIDRRVGHLTWNEIDEAEITMVKMIQKQVFPTATDFIAGLKVEKNQDDIYYVVTKLLYRQDSGRFKKPLLLPCIHPDVEKLIVEEHLRCGHAGTHFLVNKLRERFWIVHAKKAVKRVIKKCTTCIRFSRSPVTVPTAPLPENRVKNAKVFEITGVDLAGPLYLKSNEKQWVVIFTCAVIRAVHFELVAKIDTEEFILALSRFIYRRGRPSITYADCGTNFIGTANLFGNIDWKKVMADSRLQRITWIFNPPASPWWGGFWERLIRTMKEFLRKLLGHNKLTKTELDTSICYVESLMNGRPLTYVSDDPDDLVPLTPAAFLCDIEQSEFPEIEVITGSRLREKLRHLGQLKKELRDRFRSEYLGQLVQRTNPQDNYAFQLGEVVLIASEDKKRLEWPMARITELIEGTDGKIRVAKVKTMNGELTRALQRLIPMEVGNDSTIQVDSEVRTRAKEVKTPEIPEPTVKNRMRVKKKCVAVDQEVMEENLDKKSDKVTRFGRKVKAPIRFT
ncbi:uncharacterized protein LOC119083230 [Bradysia coprophila]|uniref:uncharacterized protein LOC119083230 n=1 Tax=Bradysia coprophila TaxID=38358 RepID=UPI00187D782A|nr:uncharacterized protein LOC119083230 [Bradysia coprophila]